MFLAASTHPGEDEIVAEAHKALCATYPGLLTIIVPRHPERGADIAAALRARGVDAIGKDELEGHVLGDDELGALVDPVDDQEEREDADADGEGAAALADLR